MVGITSWRRTLDTFYGPDRLQPLSTESTDSGATAAMTPVLFPAGLDPSEAPRLVAHVDGVLIPGGADVDPSGYDAEYTAST
jgi:gamma-glutamyl-gamma-aminobutyrate hydrolase PuuD